MSSNNQYLSWLSNEDLYKSLDHVINKYRIANHEQNLNRFTKNTIDPFALLFNLSLSKKTPREWINEEVNRQLQKTLENAIGEFHQIILGYCEGWENLGIGDDSQVDLKKTDGSIYAEIKNKHNTMNSSSKDSVFNKLKKILESNPNTEVYLVEIIRSKKVSYNEMWKYKENKDNRIRIASGDEFYYLVTGESDALKQLYDVIPDALRHLLHSKQEVLTESTLLHEIQLNLKKEELSSTDLTQYFFNLAYPNYQKKRTK